MSGDGVLAAVVIGAGPAGLATSRELGRRGVEHVVLERGDEPGYTWANLYDSLTLHTGKHMSALPGLPFPRSAPLFLPRASFVDYLRAYARRFELPVRTEWMVTRVDRTAGASFGWRVTRSTGETLAARTLVMTTGIVANPRRPSFPGEEEFRRNGGCVIHSVEYRRPDAFLGKRVLVVGAGNSAGEIASEIADANAARGLGGTVTLAVRTGANVVPREILGVPIQYVAYWIRRLPRPAREAIVAGVGKLIELRQGPPVLPRPPYGPLEAIPVIGFHLTDAIRAGRIAVRGGIERFTATGVRFADQRSPAELPYDYVILATGFGAALQPLGDLVRVDTHGFALRTDRITSADQPDLYFVGHNYDAAGGLYNIARDSRLAAKRIGGGRDG